MPQRVNLYVNLFNALSSGTPTSGAIDCRTFSTLVLYQTSVGTIAGGVVVIEEAATADYAGTWSTIVLTVGVPRVTTLDVELL